MRLIGQLDGEKSAARFGDILHARGIENQVERERDGAFSVWVLAEEKLHEAGGLLERYRVAPEAAEFIGAEEAARRFIEQAEAEAEAHAQKTFGRRQIWRDDKPLLTVGLILACVAVGFYTGLGMDKERIQGLSITEYAAEGGLIRWSGGLPEIRHGQIWRLITPIFIHFGAAHLLMNALCLFNLGAVLERFQGRRFLGIFTLVVAAGSNLAQYALGAPNFGGISGVLCGLFGYIWMKGRFDPCSPYRLTRQTVVMMLVWLGLCLTNFFGMIPIANTAHLVGLGIGMAWGRLAAWRR